MVLLASVGEVHGELFRARNQCFELNACSKPSHKNSIDIGSGSAQATAETKTLVDGVLKHVMQEWFCARLGDFRSQSASYSKKKLRNKTYGLSFNVAPTISSQKPSINPTISIKRFRMDSEGSCKTFERCQKTHHVRNAVEFPKNQESRYTVLSSTVRFFKLRQPCLKFMHGESDAQKLYSPELHP